MTQREKVVVSAYCGVLMCTPEELHSYVEEILKRPVSPSTLGDKTVRREVRAGCKEEFLSICLQKEKPASVPSSFEGRFLTFLNGLSYEEIEEIIPLLIMSGTINAEDDYYIYADKWINSKGCVEYISSEADNWTIYHDEEADRYYVVDNSDPTVCLREMFLVQELEIPIDAQDTEDEDGNVSWVYSGQVIGSARVNEDNVAVATIAWFDFA